MVYCNKCFEETGEKVEITTKMFDIDGTNLEELYVCSKNKEHNIEYIGTDIKTGENSSYFALDQEEDILLED